MLQIVVLAGVVDFVMFVSLPFYKIVFQSQYKLLLLVSYISHRWMGINLCMNQILLE